MDHAPSLEAEQRLWDAGHLPWLDEPQVVGASVSHFLLARGQMQRPAA